MKYGQRKTVFWLNAATRLQEGIKYHRVRQSVARAVMDTVARACHEVSIDKPDGSIKKSALAHIEVTGNVPNPVPLLWRKAGISDRDIERALKRPRRRLIDAGPLGPLPIDTKKISHVDLFLIIFWCGERGIYGKWKEDLKQSNDGNHVCQSPEFLFTPPLCFFTNESLSRFCKIVFGHKQTDVVDVFTEDNIRRRVNRLGLKYAASPKIRGLKFANDTIYFLR